jgi:uncharacterized membrane protein
MFILFELILITIIFVCASFTSQAVRDKDWLVALLLGAVILFVLSFLLPLMATDHAMFMKAYNQEMQ